jgi:hypothetical protein
MAAIACSLVLAHVPSVHNFDSTTLLFFDYTPNIGVTENNGVTLLKSRTEVYKSETKYARNGCHSQAVQTGQFGNNASHNIM